MTSYKNIKPNFVAKLKHACTKRETDATKDTMANQRNQVILHGNVKQGIKAFNISSYLILPIFYILESLITFFADETSLFALIIKAKAETISVL